jgi:DMSO/TMAO reductase YedYZ molybdopterin-dependent catalytic subunit
LVEKPLVLNFRDVLQKYDQITAPITLVCAGNRRKEQNTVRKSKGFSWGAAGLSTALFTGPMMADILRSAKPLRQAKYVCMEGADKLVRLPYQHSRMSEIIELRLTPPIAEWILWNFSEIELGHGSKSRNHAGS